jgi:hypothetical protein
VCSWCKGTFAPDMCLQEVGQAGVLCHLVHTVCTPCRPRGLSGPPGLQPLRMWACRGSLCSALLAGCHLLRLTTPNHILPARLPQRHSPIKWCLPRRPLPLRNILRTRRGICLPLSLTARRAAAPRTTTAMR